MSTPWSDVVVMHANHTASYFTATDNVAFTLADCSHCDSRQMGVIAFADSAVPPAEWLRCVTCSAPHVRRGGVLAPATPSLGKPEGMASDVARAWEETRGCLAAGAFTAAVMMCRKVIFHIAVEVGLSAKNDRGRAPTFSEALGKLETEGVYTAAMRPWVAKIVEVGNEANHELPETSEADARQVAMFTLQLLTLHYEIPHRMSSLGVAPPPVA